MKIGNHTCDECIHFDGDQCRGQNEGQVRQSWWDACDGIELAPEIPLFDGTRDALDMLSVKRI